jgi:hypothetical protein
MADILNEYLLKLILVIVLAIATWLGTQVKALYTKYVNTQIKKDVAATSVRFVEQIYKDLHGAEKLHKAMAKASELLAMNGITISEDELVALLEAAVNEFNNSFGK